MSWERILLETVPSPDRLPARIDALLDDQRARWATFRKGEAALARMRTKILTKDGARIIVQANPGRHASIHAKVDPISVSRRPCFLCTENIPADERGIGWSELVLLPNPHPILHRHLTIPTREHLPQTLRGRVEPLLDLSKHLGPDMLVLYNGPRCGASAPDHFHFQAASALGVPLFDEAPGIGEADGVTAHVSFGRRMLIGQSRDIARARDLIQTTLEVLGSMEGSHEEPLINLIALHRRGRYVTFLFPRDKHRPDGYFAEGAARISISPAALEMAGVVVVAEPDHFDRVDAAVVLEIFDEVSLEEERFFELVERVT